MKQIEFLIIGSGIAGLRAAIELSKQGKQSTIITKTTVEDSNTMYAQGGIAGVDPVRVANNEDSFESHANDTINAGKGLVNETVAHNFANQAYETIDFLMQEGVEFTKNGKSYPYELHQEGGHEHPRIYCVGDFTGKAIEETLVEVVKADPNITILEQHSAINLITNEKCLGAYVLNRETEEIVTIQAKKTFLATGGAGRVFQYTSNPQNATGDGIAMAYKAGARIANMEFVQFHPSVLYEENPKDPSEKRFLLTEALRGAKMGGILTNDKESLEDFVLNYNQEGSHSTRDIVARAIDTEMKTKGLKNVWLNVTPVVTGKSEEYIKEHFPKIYEKCLEKGIDITKEAAPVVPAAHYTCGGVLVNEHGETDIPNLYAIGEVSYTGLMGANRLASNSLTEGALYGRLAVEHALETADNEEYQTIADWETSQIKENIDVATRNQFWDTTRQIMSNMCGIDRTAERLSLASTTIDALADAANEFYWNHFPTAEIIELRNITQVAKLIVDSAKQRKESRGGHYRSDFPEMNEDYNTITIIQKELLN